MPVNPSRTKPINKFFDQVVIEQAAPDSGAAFFYEWSDCNWKWGPPTPARARRISFGASAAGFIPII
jgi:hypothetical protein